MWEGVLEFRRSGLSKVSGLLTRSCRPADWEPWCLKALRPWGLMYQAPIPPWVWSGPGPGGGLGSALSQRCSPPHTEHRTAGRRGHNMSENRSSTHSYLVLYKLWTGWYRNAHLTYGISPTPLAHRLVEATGQLHRVLLCLTVLRMPPRVIFADRILFQATQSARVAAS